MSDPTDDKLLELAEAANNVDWLGDFVKAEARQQERALDVERLARAYLDHVATAAIWPTPNARPSWVDGHRPGFGCDGQCEKANALRAALATKDPDQ
jgi:hypothetical protein